MRDKLQGFRRLMKIWMETSELKELGAACSFSFVENLVIWHVGFCVDRPGDLVLWRVCPPAILPEVALLRPWVPVRMFLSLGESSVG